MAHTLCSHDLVHRGRSAALFSLEIVVAHTLGAYLGDMISASFGSVSGMTLVVFLMEIIAAHTYAPHLLERHVSS